MTNIKILNQNSYVNYGDLIILKAELKDDNNNSINTSYLSFSINGVSHNSYSDDNKYYKYNYTVNTTGSLNISAISGYYLTNVTANTVKYYVLGDECLNLDIHDIKYGETATIISTVNEGATGSIKFNITNNNYNYVEDVNIHEGIAVLNLSNLEIGNYNISAVYSGDTRYDSATIADTFDVLKNDVNLTIQAHDIAIGEEAVIEFITDKNISNIHVGIDNSDGNIINQNLSIINYKANVTLSELSLGVYYINVTFEGDEHYNPFNQSQSLSMISNNLNNSTKDNILQKQNKFNIVNQINNDNKFENIKKKNTDNIKNVVYNIINVDNIINNKKFFGVKAKTNINNKIQFELNKKKEIINKENLNEREKKLFENEKELSNNENKINNKIMEIINMNKRLNIDKRKASQKNNIINDVIKFKKITSEKGNKNEVNIIDDTKK